jgi:hypothetical protein
MATDGDFGGDVIFESGVDPNVVADGGDANVVSDGGGGGDVVADGGGDTYVIDGSTPDLGPSTACSYAPELVYAPNMVTCYSGPVCNTHCTAETACNVAGGWHLCTVTEFLARGGKTTPNTRAAWIAGLMSKNSIPNNGISSNCNNNSSIEPDGWACDGSGTVESTSSTKTDAVSAGWWCVRLGKDVPEAAAHWESQGAGSYGCYSLCCK